jgi:hypothetical protein
MSSSDKWTNWIIRGGKMPDITETWPDVPKVDL